MSDLDKLGERVEGELTFLRKHGGPIEIWLRVAPELIAVARAAKEGEHFGTHEGYCMCGSVAAECAGRVALVALEARLAEELGD